MKTRKAQFSTYLKPIIGIIFVLLLIMVVQQVLTFQVSSEQQEREVEFVQNLPKTFQQIASCLQADQAAGNRYLLSSDMLEQYGTNYNGREPPCAEDFQYGYNVTVTPDPILLNSSEVSDEPVEFPITSSFSNADIALVIDRSGGMSGTRMTTVKEAADRFIETYRSSNRIALVSFADEATVEQGFTSDSSALYPRIAALEAGGRTDLAAGINAANGLDWERSEQHMIVVTDGGDTSTAVQQAADEARSDGKDLHSVMFGSNIDTRTMTEITGWGCETGEGENSDGDTCWWQDVGAANRSRSEVLNGLRDYYDDSLVDEIDTAKYTFGEQNRSSGNSLRERVTLNYPVSIRYAADLVLPGTMELELRDGDLEFLVGFLNKVVKQGRNQGGPFFSAPFEYANSQEVCSTGGRICLAGERSCISLQQPSGDEVDIEPFSLQPGRYTLTANYSNTENTLYVNGGQTGGCNS